MNNTSTFGLGELGQIALTITDLEKAVAFYRDVLGLRHLFSAPPGLAFFACGNVRLMLSRPEAPEGERLSAALYFKVADINAAHSILASRGVSFEAAPHLVARMPDHELWLAFFHDPDRNLLALMSEVRGK
jgi:methylmalonyl-CoA/ethylmalonyl-CoA epimerase